MCFPPIAAAASTGRLDRGPPFVGRIHDFRGSHPSTSLLHHPAGHHIAQIQAGLAFRLGFHPGELHVSDAPRGRWPRRPLVHGVNMAQCTHLIVRLVDVHTFDIDMDARWHQFPVLPQSCNASFDREEASRIRLFRSPGQPAHNMYEGADGLPGDTGCCLGMTTASNRSVSLWLLTRSGLRSWLGDVRSRRR